MITLKHSFQRILILFLLCASSMLSAKELQKRQITVHSDSIKCELSTCFKSCVGAGRAHEGLYAEWQNQLKEVKADCGFQRIRFHGLFHDDMGVYDENKNGVHLNFQYIDALYDFLLENDVVPFVELSFMPDKLKSGDQTVFWWKGNVTPPADYEKWGKLVEGLASHLKERYGEEEVSKWYFEVWNEPNLKSFFTGTRDDYFKLYETSAKAIKKVSENFKVGGPATAGCRWIKEFLSHCEKEKLPVDFITTHIYGVEGFLDEFGKKQLQMPENVDKVVNGVRNVSKELKSLYKYSNLEIHFTEWSSSFSPRDAFHDVYQNAPYVLNTLRKTNDIAESMSYWTFTDIFEEVGAVTRPFHGGFGLMNFQGIKKPTYFVYKFLNELGSTELKCNDSNSWVCKDDKNNYQFLFWNLKHLDQGKKSNSAFYTKVLPSANAEEVIVNIKGIEPGSYLRGIYRIGYKLNDPFTAYCEMGSPEKLTPVQVESLKKFASGEAVDRKIITITKDKSYSESFITRDNDVFFVKPIHVKDIQ